MTNYKDKHNFEPSGEKNLGKELCKCGLPYDIPSMHFMEDENIITMKPQSNTIEQRIEEIIYDDDGKMPAKGTIKAMMDLFKAESEREKRKVVDSIKNEMLLNPSGILLSAGDDNFIVVNSFIEYLDTLTN